MDRLKAIVSNGSGSGQAGVDDGSPAFQPMVAITME